MLVYSLGMSLASLMNMATDYQCLKMAQVEVFAQLAAAVGSVCHSLQ